MKRLGLAALAVVFVLALACAREPGEPEAVRGSFSYEPTAEEPLLQLSYSGGMIENPDPTPFIRVYPNGRVLVHYPAYMKKAGDYELELNESELAELMAAFADESILKLENEELMGMAAQARSTEDDLRVSNTHQVSTILEIRADSFTREGEEEPTLLMVDRILSTEDLAATAAALPEVRRLNDLSEGVRALESLADRDTLSRMETDSPPD